MAFKTKRLDEAVCIFLTHPFEIGFKKFHQTIHRGVFLNAVGNHLGGAAGILETI